MHIYNKFETNFMSFNCIACSFFSGVLNICQGLIIDFYEDTCFVPRFDWMCAQLVFLKASTLDQPCSARRHIRDEYTLSTTFFTAYCSLRACITLILDIAVI